MTANIKPVLTAAKKLNGKFFDEDVTPALREVVEQYLREYDGTFEFLVSCKGKLQMNRLTTPMVRGTLNCIVAEASRAKQPKTVKQLVPAGTYTVLFDSKGKDYVTLRLREDKKGYFTNLPEGALIAQFLYGPDNSTQFAGFAFVLGENFNVWGKFRDNERLSKALTILLTSGKYPEFGQTYALKSGRCCRCGKRLTVPASLHRGMGPDCAGVR